MKTCLTVFVAALVAVLSPPSITNAEVIAVIQDMEDPDGSVAAMAAGAFSGNDRQGNNGVTELTNSFGDLGWVLTGGELSGDNGTSGNLTLSQDVNGPFAIALKASNSFSLYKFEGNYNAGDEFWFRTDGTSKNKKGRTQALSHASLYIASSAIPEPGSLLMWGTLAGLFAMNGQRRRRVT